MIVFTTQMTVKACIYLVERYIAIVFSYKRIVKVWAFGKSMYHVTKDTHAFGYLDMD